MEYQHQMKIPLKRVPILIGKNGETKKEIESSTKTKINVNSKEGEVTITSDDGLKVYQASEIVKAIGRGFNPDLAMKLLKTEYVLSIIDLSKHVGDAQSQIRRIKGRIIGKEGKSRTTIEKLTNTNINVFGKTVSIIGQVQEVEMARRAIGMLLGGARHSTVFSFLERQKKSIVLKHQFEKRLLDKDSELLKKPKKEENPKDD